MNPPASKIAALTSFGRGAVATVVVWGVDAAKLIAARFVPAGKLAVERFSVGRIHFGNFRSLAETTEELVVCRTADRCWEIHCHGGTTAVQAVIAALVAEGGTAVDAAVWLAEQPLTVIQREACEALARAATERSAKILLRQYHGSLQQEVWAIAQLIVDSETDAAQKRLQQLHQTYHWGEHLTSPWQVVLCGPPNVGKSSLINALVGYERAIVQDLPGTTRDVVTTHLVRDGWQLALSDTAGWRQSDDELEQQGIALARRQIDQADLLVIVTDVATGWTTEAARFTKLGKQHLLVVNKCDLLPTIEAAQQLLKTLPATAQGLTVSAQTRQGLDALSTAITAQLVDTEVDFAPAIFAERQEKLIAAALQSLAEENYSSARKSLAELCGLHLNPLD